VRNSTISAIVALGCCIGFAGCAQTHQSVVPSTDAAARGSSPLSGAASNVSARLVHPLSGPSWMDPAAKNKPLLYISSYDDYTVYVYSYPTLKKVGALTGIYGGPDGICVNRKNGNVYVVANFPAAILVYKHGGTSPIATLSDDTEYAVSCDVDPATGNLAVSNYRGYFSNNGNIAIFAKGKGTAKTYTDNAIQNFLFCGYDPKGNLFVNGANGTYQFAEMAKGKKTFKNIKITGGSIIFPGTIRWDGKYLAMSDQEYKIVGNYYDSAVMRITPAGKIVFTEEFEGSQDVEGFWIDGKTIIGPDNNLDVAGVYKYPVAQAKPTKTIKGFASPHGAAISE
jgi:hypothetical protein